LTLLLPVSNNTNCGLLALNNLIRRDHWVDLFGSILIFKGNSKTVWKSALLLVFLESDVKDHEFKFCFCKFFLFFVCQDNTIIFLRIEILFPDTFGAKFIIISSTIEWARARIRLLFKSSSRTNQNFCVIRLLGFRFHFDLLPYCLNLLALKGQSSWRLLFHIWNKFVSSVRSWRLCLSIRKHFQSC